MYNPEIEKAQSEAKGITEKRIIGDLILNKESVEFYRLVPSEFISKGNKAIFESVLQSYGKGTTEKHLIVYELKKQFPNLDLTQYLQFEDVNYFNTMKTYRNCQIICDQYFDQKASELINDYQSGQIEYAEIEPELNQVRAKFPEFFNKTDGGDFCKYIDDSLTGDFIQITSKQFPFVQRIFGSLEAGNVITISAKSGIGKSLFALQLLIDLIESNKLKGVYYSLEMSEIELMQRLISAKFNINSLELRNRNYFKRLDKVNIEILKDYAKYAKNRLIIYDKYFELNPILNSIRQLKNEYPDLKFVVVDFVNQIKLSTKGENRYHEIREIMQGLKQIAIEQDLIIFAVAQSNRSNEIADSYTVYQLSDYMLNLTKPAMETETQKEKTILIGNRNIEINEYLWLIKVEKNRHTEFNGNSIPLLMQKNRLCEMDLTAKSPATNHYYSKIEDEKII